MTQQGQFPVSPAAKPRKAKAYFSKSQPRDYEGERKSVACAAAAMVRGSSFGCRVLQSALKFSLGWPRQTPGGSTAGHIVFDTALKPSQFFSHALLASPAAWCYHLATVGGDFHGLHHHVSDHVCGVRCSGGRVHQPPEAQGKLASSRGQGVEQFTWPGDRVEPFRDRREFSLNAPESPIRHHWRPAEIGRGLRRGLGLSPGLGDLRRTSTGQL
jgi:hypothetical protein